MRLKNDWIKKKQTGVQIRTLLEAAQPREKHLQSTTEHFINIHDKHIEKQVTDCGAVESSRRDFTDPDVRSLTVQKHRNLCIV